MKISFTKFLHLLPSSSPQPASPLEQQKVEVIKKADQYLDANLLTNYHLLVKNGYVATKKQEEKFLNLYEQALKQYNWPLVEQLLENGFELPNAHIVTYMATHLQETRIIPNKRQYTVAATSLLFDSLVNQDDITRRLIKDKFNYPHILNHIHHRDFMGRIVEDFITTVHELKPFSLGDKAYSSLHLWTFSRNTPSKYVYEIIKNIPQDTYREMLGILQQGYAGKKKIYFGKPDPHPAVAYLHKEMNNHMFAIFQQQHHQDIAQVKGLYLEEKVKIELSSKATQVHLNQLPPAVQKLLEEIEAKASTILTAKQGIELPQQLEVQNIVDNTLPKLLTESLSMSPEKRFNMFNDHGQNSHQLLLESLSQINGQVQEMVTGKDENHLRGMMVLNRYVKAKTM